MRLIVGVRNGSDHLVLRFSFSSTISEATSFGVCKVRIFLLQNEPALWTGKRASSCQIFLFWIYSSASDIRWRKVNNPMRFWNAATPLQCIPHSAFNEKPVWTGEKLHEVATGIQTDQSIFSLLFWFSVPCFCICLRRTNKYKMYSICIQI